MDILKHELLKKRQSLADDAGGKTFFKRSEIEQKRLQRLRDEEKRDAEAKALLRQKQSLQEQHRNDPASSSNPSSNPDIPKSKPEPSSKSLAEEQNIDDLNLPRPEVVRRLRFLKQPVTLFGEDNHARLDRLKFVLKAGLFEVDDSDMTECQTNDFLRDIVKLKKQQKSGIMSDRKRKARDDGGDGDKDLSGDGAFSGADHDKDMKRMKANFEDLCDEDKILVFF